MHFAARSPIGRVLGRLMVSEEMHEIEPPTAGLWASKLLCLCKVLMKTEVGTYRRKQESMKTRKHA